ncbi:Na(+)/K(+)-transporting ATPase subunit beta-1-interacting protein 4, partial [Intoshia linei]
MNQTKHRYHRFLQFLLVLQFIFLAFTEIFDFIGYLWMPIIFNFLYANMVILTIYAVTFFCLNILLLYYISSIIWIVWNLLSAIIYLNFPFFDKYRSYVLSFGIPTNSFWLNNEINCKYLPLNSVYEDNLPYQPLPGCTFDYRYIEVSKAAIHILITLLVLFIFKIKSNNFKKNA